MADTQTPVMWVIGGTSQSASLGLDGCQGSWAHPRPLASAPSGLAVEWGWLGQGVLLGEEKEQLLLISFSFSLLFHTERVFKDCLGTSHTCLFINCSSQPQLMSTQAHKMAASHMAQTDCGLQAPGSCEYFSLLLTHTSRTYRAMVVKCFFMMLISYLCDPRIPRRNDWGSVPRAWGKTHAGDARPSICSGCSEVTPGTCRETRADNWGWRDALGHPCSVHPECWSHVLGGLCKDPVILLFPDLLIFRSFG